MSSDDLTHNLDDHTLLLELVTMFREFDGRQRAFGERLEALEEKLDALQEKVEALEEKVEALEEKVEEHLYDTRAIWESVRVQIMELREATEKGFRKLDSKWELLAREVRDLYADEKELERRVGNLESKVT